MRTQKIKYHWIAASKPKGAKALSRILHPFSYKERLFVVLRAYLDDTGTHGVESPVVGICGWAAPCAVWEEWEKEWSPFLNRWHLKWWKHSDFESKRNDYANWKHGDFLAARRELCNIIGKARLFGVGVAVIHEEYICLVKGNRFSLPPDPYAFCLDRCLATLFNHLFEYPTDEGIAVYCDRNKQQQKIGKVLSAWHENYVIHQADPEYRGRDVSTTYGPKDKYIPLQAADVLANEGFRLACLDMQGKTKDEIFAERPIIKTLLELGSLPNFALYSRNEIVFEIENDLILPSAFFPSKPKIF